jgi:hypothetical protein
VIRLRYLRYRSWQRLLHRFHLHHTRTMGPLQPGGGYVERCNWCGISRGWGRDDEKVPGDG